jgi:phosphoglycolate phosphatase
MSVNAGHALLFARARRFPTLLPESIRYGPPRQNRINRPVASENSHSMPEFLRPIPPIEGPRAAVFDFDGTLSLIRSGWVEIMVDQMVDVLQPLPGTAESDADLAAYVTDFVLNLNGRPTIFQMDFFVNEVRLRGGRPDTPEFYKQQFLNSLLQKSQRRISALRSGQLTTDDLLVPGSRTMLTDLAERGVQLSLASGTAVKDVRVEAALLGIDHFFKGRIFGPEENPREFSKLEVMQQTLEQTGIHGRQLLGFGDGYVEIESVKQLGGIAVGCATDEDRRSGQVEDWKRTRLIQAGADVIVPDYQNWPKLADTLFAPRPPSGESRVAAVP